MNNWHVITGAPCSGKTTILEALERRGYKTYSEAARIYIDQEMRLGKILTEIRKDELEFQKKILRLKIKLEKKLPKGQLLFLERGIPDSLAYYELCGDTQDPILKNALKNSWYKKVFLLDLLDYKKDYARIEDFEKARELDALLEKSYKNLGLNVDRIPVMPIEERTSFILNKI